MTLLNINGFIHLSAIFPPLLVVLTSMTGIPTARHAAKHDPDTTIITTFIGKAIVLNRND